MRTALFASLLALPLFTGCAAVAVGAVGGLVMRQEVSASNVYETRLNANIDRVWATVKTELSNKSMKPITIDEDVKSAKASIDGISVTVWCEAWDLDKSVMRTRATKYAGTINDAEYARIITEIIVGKLEAQEGSK